MSAIAAGSYVTVTDAEGKVHPGHATSGLQPGRDFPVIWVCFCEDGECDGDMAMPWPADAVEGGSR